MVFRHMGKMFARRCTTASLLIALTALAITPVVATPQDNHCQQFCTPPVFDPVPRLEFTENEGNSSKPVMIIGQVTATDADVNDIIVYEQLEDPDDLPGEPPKAGSDALLFDIDSLDGTTGEIKTKSGVIYDLEKRLAETGRDYFFVRIVACDNASSRTRINVRIYLNDVNEPPLKPDPPAVEGASPMSLSVSWTAPDNEGRPPITDYDLQYRKNATWLSWTHNGPETNTVISGLDPGIAYEVQVLARNHETREEDRAWSDSGIGSTHEDDGMDRPPVFREGSSTARGLSENIGQILQPVRNIGNPVAATNDDGDALTYSLLEINDWRSFDIDSRTGQLKSKSGEVYDHEGKSTYHVKVRVVEESPSENSDDSDVTINITDLDEPPLAPDRPVVSSDPMSNAKLVVNWTEPDNAGRPSITGYDLQYRQGTSGSWTDGPQNESGTSVPITNLAEGRPYQVHVRARNNEGDGPWSQPGTGSTNASDNAPPVFGTATSRDFREDVEAGHPIGAPVTATDDDLSDPNKNEKLTYSLEGTDPDSFTIDSETGQIRTISGVTYDYESKNSYSVRVKATDSRHASATIFVTISVTDVAEAPDAPDAPTVTTGPHPYQTTRLSVTWNPPDNPGRPTITDYDVQYRKNGTNDLWTPRQHNGIGTSTIISDLAPDTEYEVQVQAKIGQLAGPWSPSGTGRTAATGQSNKPPSFSGTSTARSFPEHVGAGHNIRPPVTATDDDGDTLTYTLLGTDASSFTIVGTSGQIQDHVGGLRLRDQEYLPCHREGGR